MVDINQWPTSYLALSSSIHNSPFSHKRPLLLPLLKAILFQTLSFLSKTNVFPITNTNVKQQNVTNPKRGNDWLSSSRDFKVQQGQNGHQGHHMII